MYSSKDLAQTSNDVADKAAQSADGVIKSTQRVANDALNSLSETVNAAHDQAAPVINRVASQVEHIARRSIDAARDGSQQIEGNKVHRMDFPIAPHAVRRSGLEDWACLRNRR